jgi:hypothetical protein
VKSRSRRIALKLTRMTHNSHFECCDIVVGGSSLRSITDGNLSPIAARIRGTLIQQTISRRKAADIGYRFNVPAENVWRNMCFACSAATKRFFI